MKAILYSSYNCPHSSKLAFFLAEKGVDFERVEVSLSKKAHKTKAYLALNPRGTVPSFEDDSGIIGDSLEAMQYIDKSYPGRKFFPEDSLRREDVLAWIKRADTEFWHVSHHLYWQLLEPPSGGTHWDKVAELKSQGMALLAELELRLSKEAFVCGDYSAADIALVPWVFAFKRFQLPEEGRFPHVEVWRDRLSSQASFQNNYNQKSLLSLQEFLAKRSQLLR